MNNCVKMNVNILYSLNRKNVEKKVKGVDFVRKVEVCSYHKIWLRQFADEAGKLNRIFQNEIIDIHHIGSTAVPGLRAKPVIDMMPVVKNIVHVDYYNKKMQDIGYEAKGENGISERRFFQKGGDKRTHHVHVFQEESFHIVRHLAFRDYLREHTDEKVRYGNLKENLAKQFPNNTQSYINGKESLVKEIEAKALDWYEKKSRRLPGGA